MSPSKGSDEFKYQNKVIMVNLKVLCRVCSGTDLMLRLGNTFKMLERRLRLKEYNFKLSVSSLVSSFTCRYSSSMVDLTEHLSVRWRQPSWMLTSSSKNPLNHQRGSLHS